LVIFSSMDGGLVRGVPQARARIGVGKAGTEEEEGSGDELSLTFSEVDSDAETPDSGHLTSDSGHQTSDTGHQTPESHIKAMAAALVEDRPSTPTKRLETLQKEHSVKDMIAKRDSLKKEGSKSFLDQMRTVKPSGQIGFSSLPSQVYRRSLRRGFEFSLMVVGESGLGKSTLVNSMFLTDIYSSASEEVAPAKQTLEVETHSVVLEEGGVKLSLTVVDTPGFGDQVDNSGCWLPISSYVDEQFDKFLEAETRVNRIELVDSRVHACLYFIAPSGHGLKALDKEFMKKLCGKVNIIPVIGKADTLTKTELAAFKQKILVQLKESSILTYEFPMEEGKTEEAWMRNLAPFAVVGSNTVIVDDSGRKVRGRSYPWGTVNIEERQHCDFQALRTLVLAHHMQDLKDVTSHTHYENYRTGKLTAMMNSGEEDGGALTAVGDEIRSRSARPTRTDVKEPEEKVEPAKKTVEVEKQESDKLRQLRRGLEEEQEREGSRTPSVPGRKTWENSSSVNLSNFLGRSTESLDKKKKYGLPARPFKFGRS